MRVVFVGTDEGDEVDGTWAEGAEGAEEVWVEREGSVAMMPL